MGITQRDIADALHISLITVHRALNNSGYVSKDLKDRILAYAKEVEYVPHAASRVLVRNRLRKIAVFSSSLPRYFWEDIGTGIAAAAEQIRALDYKVDYYRIPEYDTSAYIERIEMAIGEGVEAIGIANQWIYDMKSIFARIEEAGIPYVTLNVDAPDSKRICYVGTDYRAGGRLAAEFLGTALSFKVGARVLVIGTREEIPPDSSAPDINHQRLEGFLSVMCGRFGNVACEVEEISSDIRSKDVQSRLDEILAARSGYDAVYLIAAFNTQFIAALENCRPTRPALTLLHDLDTSSHHHLETGLLTAVIYQNPILQGYYTVKLLESILETGTDQKPAGVDIVHSVILNENKDLYRNHHLFARM
jgi:LacI family transcriptional regulator